MSNALESRINRLEQTGANVDALVHFFTIKCAEDEAAMKAQLAQASPNAVVFITRYEPSPALLPESGKPTIGIYS